MNGWMDGMIHVWTEINQCSCNDLSFCILGGNNTNGLPASLDGLFMINLLPSFNKIVVRQRTFIGWRWDERKRAKDLISSKGVRRWQFLSQLRHINHQWMRLMPASIHD